MRQPPSPAHSDHPRCTLRIFLSLTIVALAFCVGLAGHALACPTVPGCAEADATGDQIHFINVSGTIEIDFHNAKIAGVGGGVSDPLIGSYQILTSSGMPHNYQYVLGNEIAPGVYSLTNAAGSTLTLASKANGTNPYLTGTTTAQAINFNTGIISWSPVSNLNIHNTINSPTLAGYTNAGSAGFAFAFETDSVLRNWLTNPQNTLNRTYGTSLTDPPLCATPEPAMYLLWLVGLGGVGTTLYVRKPRSGDPADPVPSA
jgi:hypothetical protein